MQLPDLNVLDHFGHLPRQANHLPGHMWFLVGSFLVICSEFAAVAPMGRACEIQIGAGARQTVVLALVDVGSKWPRTQVSPGKTSRNNFINRVGVPIPIGP